MLKCLFFSLLLTSCNWTIDAYDEDTAENQWPNQLFNEKVSAVLNDPSTKFFFSKKDIPHGVFQAYRKSSNLKFANPDKPFNCGCIRDRLPGGQIILFAKRQNECVFFFKKGGRACNAHLAYFVLEDQKLKQMHVVSGFQHESNNIETLKNELKNWNQRVGDWRF